MCTNNFSLYLFSLTLNCDKMRRIMIAFIAFFAMVNNCVATELPDYSAYTTPELGDRVLVFHDTDDPSEINRIINGIELAMRKAEFSANRFAIYLAPGNYEKAGELHVGYYTSLAGLGEKPYDVIIENIYVPAAIRTNNVLCNFWRSLENLYVISNSTDTMRWSVSQAAPIRRVVSDRYVLYDVGGYGSGGFTADCRFMKSTGSRTQQQWYTRNSYLENGSDGLNPGGWNYALQGVEFGENVNLENNSDNWSKGNLWGNVSRVETTPIVREKPFLCLGKDGRFKVFRPDFRYDSKGVSYTKESAGEGEMIDLLEEFLVVKPGVTTKEINKALARGRHVFFTPGTYELDEPLLVKKDNTILLGTGLATLVPAAGNDEAAVILEDGVENVTVSSLMFDAFYNSRTLMRVGSLEKGPNTKVSKPCVLSDLFFRVGGVKEEKTNADVMLEINSNNVIGDHFWIWRADHGKGVGWHQNTCKNGLIVNGNDVTIYGLFNEHTQEYQTLWNGENGRCYFYQSETPYDPYNQSLYMSHNGTVKGYSAYKVSDSVKRHYACMMGMYDVFVRTRGADIAIENAIEVPETEGVRIHHACNFGISRPVGGFNYLINGMVKSTHHKKGRYFILDYPVK